MKPEKFLINVLIFILLINFSIAKDKQIGAKADFFPVSVWYSGGKARAPMLSSVTPQSEEEWRKDLKQIKELGFNTVRTWVEWAACEPIRGKYNFQNLRLLLKLAQEVGLKVFIQVYVDSAPDWVAQKFPHALFEAQSGDKVYPQAAPGACTDNNEVREAVLGFYTEAAKVASSFPNFFGWDLWSEPHIINWAQLDYVPNIQFCFCPGTRARFREWLQEKYGSLEKLNQAWYRIFSDWNQVDPPRFSTILSYTDFIDWKTFIYKKLEEDMKMRYNAVRKGDPTHLITAHAVGASLFQSPHVGAGATDDFLMAKPLDYYGVSLYPKHNQPDRHWSLIMLQTIMDFTRSANRDKGGWYVGELQAGFGTIALLVSNPVTPDDHRIWMWSAIAKGAKGINIYAYYPMSTGYEAGGYGLINLDGTVTERARKAGGIASIVNKNQNLFLTSTPVKAQVAIVYNPLSQMVGGMQRRDYPSALTNSLIGYFQAFINYNIPVDFIHREQLEKQEISQYKLIIVPWPVMFTQKAADGLKSFVSNGGNLLAEARIAWNDERGFASGIIPGLGLHEMFGVREEEVRMQETIPIEMAEPSNLLFADFKPGQKLKGSIYAESLTPLENHKVFVLARFTDGSAAMTCANYGKGKAMMSGSFIGNATYPETDPGNTQFMVNLMNWAGIERPFTTSHDGISQIPVEVRLQENEKGYLLFILNHSNGQQEVTVDLKVPVDGSYLVREVITEKTSTLKSRGNRLNLTILVGTREVQVLDITLTNP